MPHCPTPASTRIAAAERQRAALELRKAGLTFEQIAGRLGFANRSAAFKAVTRALRDIPKEQADELRTLECERLDQMLLGIWDKAVKGDTWSIDRALAIMERRARLLGLDAPAKLDQVITARSLVAQVAGELGMTGEELAALSEQAESLVKRLGLRR